MLGGDTGAHSALRSLYHWLQMLPPGSDSSCIKALITWFYLGPWAQAPPRWPGASALSAQSGASLNRPGVLGPRTLPRGSRGRTGQGSAEEGPSSSPGSAPAGHSPGANPALREWPPHDPSLPHHLQEALPAPPATSHLIDSSAFTVELSSLSLNACHSDSNPGWGCETPLLIHSTESLLPPLCSKHHARC